MAVLMDIQEIVARHSSTICGGILWTFQGCGDINVEMLWAAHHPSVFSMSEHEAVLTRAERFEKQFVSATPLRLRQQAGG